ncbi:MAG: nitrous oxide reductase family maturation protein NosD [Alphaproteobacteria bacterium]|nr:nitrous oxide reductase family maturation protein NosD [Alphaproteobacteria bacterium]
MGLSLLLVAWASGTQAQTIPVSQLIADARPGAVVTVTAGLHHGPLLIDKPLTLFGAPGAVIDGDGKGDVIRIAAPAVTIRNLMIRNSGTDLTAMNAGIYIEKNASNAVIAGNTLQHVLFGVYLDGPAGTKVIGNQIEGITTLRRVDRGDGIHLWNDTGVLVQGNDVSDTRDGIYIYVSPHNKIIDNRIHGVRYGIHYMYSNHDVVAHNVSFGNRAGFALMQSDHLVVRGNRSDGDRDFGILLNYVTYSDFSGNSVKAVIGEKDFSGIVIPSGEGKGIFVYNSEFDRFHQNVIANCPIGIHVTAGSDHETFYGNAFVGNRVQVEYVQNADEEWSWNGVGNYWSDYLGWDMDGDGIGDVPYRPNDGVDVLLWEYPSASLLMDSPAILALRYVQRAFPVFMSPGVQDSYPLMKRSGVALAEKRTDLHAERD